MTVEDSSSDEAPQEKEEGKGEGGNAIHEDARAGGEGERREKDNEWCKQSSVTDGRSCDGERGGEKEGGVSTGVSGAGSCRRKISLGSRGGARHRLPCNGCTTVVYRLYMCCIFRVMCRTTVFAQE